MMENITQVKPLSRFTGEQLTLIYDTATEILNILGAENTSTIGEIIDAINSWLRGEDAVFKDHALDNAYRGVVALIADLKIRVHGLRQQLGLLEEIQRLLVERDDS